MSQDWARQQKNLANRQRRKGKAKATAPPSLPPPDSQALFRSPLSYSTFKYLQRCALNQNFVNRHLTQEAHAELEGEWWAIVDESFEILNDRFTCRACRMIHKSEKTVEKMAKLRENMDKADVESIDEVIIGKWKGMFEEIEKGYREEMISDWCSEFGVEFGTLFTPHDGLQVVEEAEALLKERAVKMTPTKEKQTLIEDFFLLE